MPTNRGFMTLSLLTPIPAVALGVYAAHDSGIAFQAFLPNVVGVILGIPIALWFKTRGTVLFERHLSIMVTIIVSVIAATLFFPGMESVSRWLQVGPLNVNASMAFAPLLIYALHTSFRQKSRAGIFAAIALSTIHIIQPDAGQQTAFCLASIALLWGAQQLTNLQRWSWVLFAAIAIAFAWLRPDPLPSIKHVELIVHLIFGMGPTSVVLFWLCSALLLSPFLIGVYKNYREKRIDHNDFAVAAIVYLIAGFVVTECGNFPVPIFGAGLSSILGWYALLGLLKA
ncbi:MAG: hypothetical protein NTV34_04345 [Proteobacteria bacterium]|nr:hypothetical protein [Pseudomonadota bacterium]